MFKIKTYVLKIKIYVLKIKTYVLKIKTYVLKIKTYVFKIKTLPRILISKSHSFSLFHCLSCKKSFIKKLTIDSSFLSLLYWNKADFGCTLRKKTF